MGTIKRYFADGNTARGFVCLADSNLRGLKKLYALEGGAMKWMTALIEETGAYWHEKGYDIDYLHCALENANLDGLIIPALGAGIINDTPPHRRTGDPEGAKVERIHLGSAYRVTGHEDNIALLTLEAGKACNLAYETFAKALSIHDEWEALFIKNMDFEEADIFAQEISGRFLNCAAFNKTSVCRHRFFGAATPDGAVDFVPNLTQDIPKRYLLKGRPGTGKSTLLKKMIAAAEMRGIDLEIYHCGFDPESIDMMIAPEIGKVVFDSTAPHEYFIVRDNDELIDMYGALVKPGTDELYAQEIERIVQDYKQKIGEATAYLKKARTMNHALDAIYTSRADNAALDKIKSEIQKGIARMA